VVAVEQRRDRQASERQRQKTVAKFRAEIAPNVTPEIRSEIDAATEETATERTFTTKHGTVAKMNTAAIGKKSAATKLTPMGRAVIPKLNLQLRVAL
jgi:hypothetical protein